MVESKDPQQKYEEDRKMLFKTKITADLLSFRRNHFPTLKGKIVAFWDVLGTHVPPISACHVHREPGSCTEECQWYSFYAAYRSLKEEIVSPRLWLSFWLRWWIEAHPPPRNLVRRRPSTSMSSPDKSYGRLSQEWCKALWQVCFPRSLRAPPVATLAGASLHDMRLYETLRRPLGPDVNCLPTNEVYSFSLSLLINSFFAPFLSSFRV